MQNIINERILELISKYFDNTEKIMSLLLPGFQFRLIESNNALIFSRFGKIPNLPINFDWPSYNDEKLSFLCQIDLSEINHDNEYLPKKGILYFFILKKENEFPNKKGQFKVIYIENTSKINRNFVKNNDLNISFFERLTFPSYQEYIMEEKNISEDESNIIDEIESEIYLNTSSFEYDLEHQILGHPSAVQGTVRYWWAMKFLQLDEDALITKEEMQSIEKQEENFIMLLQINFCDSKIIGFQCFGDSVAYFGIHKDDLIEKNFDNVILVIQDT